MVSSDNGKEMRIRVENEGFWKNQIIGGKIAIGWDETDTVVLKGELKKYGDKNQSNNTEFFYRIQR